MSFLVLFFFTLGSHELVSNPTDIPRFTVRGSVQMPICAVIFSRGVPPGSQVSTAQFSCLVPKLRRREDSAFLQFNRHESNYLPNCFNSAEAFEMCTAANVPMLFLNSSQAARFL